MIECSGVLHHMHDPVVGLRALPPRLAPNGVIKLGLYSARARAHVQSLRARLTDPRDSLSVHAQSDLTESIIRIRQQLLRGEGGEDGRKILLSPDFYTLSGTRDLLFHVQELLFTPLRIQRLLSQCGLRFLGFVHLKPSDMAAYRAQFPQDRDGTDLSCWEQFEALNPHCFSAMYQFYCTRVE